MNLHLIKLISAIIILLSAITEIIAPIRLCEVQGTCFKCPDGHFSHFLCRSNVDCFAGEYCLQQRGFCCPGDGFSAGKGSQLENGTAPASLLCPDGSSWDRMCKTDADCLFRDELCAEGRCCPSCRQRRLQALKELRNFGSSPGGRDAADEFIPQCSDDGKHFRPMQCTGGSGECFCVDKLGRHQHSRKRDRGSRRQPLNCTNLREEEESEANNNSKGQGLTRVALNRDRWAVAGANDPQQSLEPTVPDERSPKQPQQQQPQHCADPLREFRHCGSACPISCATRTMPRCPQEQCMQGCFCRLPYVILDAGDPNGSRCVLPAECPLLQFTPELDQWNGGFFPANQYQQQQQQQQYSMTPLLPSAPPGSNRVGKCNDPLKNWQSCGSACPAGCGRMNPAVLADCSAHCVSGCFCRVPYVLQNPEDPANSACILPQQCVPSLPPQMPPLLSAAAEAQLCKPSRNQSWTGCFSRKCSRSCGEWPPFCVPDDCQPGCECQPPAVVRDKSATVWECVLPEDCPRQRKKSGKTAEEEQETTAVKAAAADEKEKCEDQRKEFLSCGSSCPLGCDRLDQPLRQCSPCVSGCFCRNGFVFANASDWRTSGCVPLEECPSAAANKAQDQPPAPVKATTITAIQHVEGVPQPPICPANALDRDGKLCLNDGECGTQRRCCSSSSSSTPNNTSAIVASAARCTCRDPNALWTDCGPLCVDHCAQSARRLCPGPCRPGCFCPPGFVKRTADPDSECVPVAQCAVGGEESIDVSDEEKACGEALASASLYTRDGMRIGRLVARPERPAAGAATRRIRLSGDFAPPSIPPLLLNAGLVLSIHQFSDTTINGCAGVGLPLRLRLVEGNGAENDSGGGGGKTVEELPAIRRENGISFGLDQRIEWPDPIGQGTNPLIGHSVVLQQVAGDEQYRSVIACAVLGIAPSC